MGRHYEIVSQVCKAGVEVRAGMTDSIMHYYDPTFP